MEKQQGSHELDSFAQLDGAAQEEVIGGAGAEMVDYMLGQAPQPPQGAPHGQVSLDKLSFSDVLQFADFGPRLALNHPSADHNDNARDDDGEDSYFFRFQSHELSAADDPDPRGASGIHHAAEQDGGSNTADGSGGARDQDHGGGISESTTLVQQSDGGGRVTGQKAGGDQAAKSGRRKRPRSTKTSEEVESQRMTHIAVERNRRRQMNDYLRVLRSLMPGSYVQRGDQASIIGGAIEFIRELEQLIQCLESQKRRRLYGDTPRPVADGTAGAVPATTMHEPPPPQGHEVPPFYVSPSLPFPAVATGDGGAAGKVMVDLDTCGSGLTEEEVAENKSSLADIEVRVLGEDAVIKVLSRRRPEQLIKTIAVLEEMHMSILHTNITTIEQTVLYSFNVKIAGEPRFTAEDIVGAVHQILTFIDVNYTL
ncbi:transcription factor FAMA-like isoform X1 [Lolium rigidum]|uniref:transcription factor FAMA-like isoform X1 n=1 Tax=Lolium rigidum TaxID=89674 RepID=UPI001F5C7877|nr:transcription factor FAMA-like isoform X1 [Lolium rigidum]